MFGARVLRSVTCSLWRLSLAASRTASAATSTHHAASLKVDQANLKSLKERLTAEQYHVTQEKGTERPFSGVYNHHSDPGTYKCVVCDDVLFSSDSKFDSGCGWPAFSDVLDKSKVKLTPDFSHGSSRTEVTCNKCGAHLGHVFDDGPKPTGQRYCINSASLNFAGKK